MIKKLRDILGVDVDTSSPNTLYRLTQANFTRLADKVDEIIDHLEASKENKYLCYTCNQWGTVGEHKCEASKGECKKWCKHNQSLAGDEGYFRCNLCNPPEHEDWEEAIHEGTIRDIQRLTKELRVEQTLDYIKANFVSKEKIKREGKLTISEMQKTIGWQPSYKAGYMDAIKDLLNSLGLGD